MGKLSYVVVSTPRSATGWASQVLTAMGLQCGHETYYNLHLQQPENKNEGIWGDSSWLAVPFIKYLPSGTIVLHQIRNPWDTIASLVGLGWFGPADELDPGEDGYLGFAIAFAQGHMPYLGSDMDQHVNRAAAFWMVWHMMIELYAKARSDLTYVRYQVESPCVAATMYRAVTGNDPCTGSIARVEGIDRKYNTGHYDKPVVSPRKLGPHVVELANRYGYPE